MRAFQPVNPVASVGFLTDDGFTMQTECQPIRETFILRRAAWCGRQTQQGASFLANMSAALPF